MNNKYTKKATFSLPIDIILYLQTKENQTGFVAEAIKRLKEEEEKKKIIKACKEMNETKEIWEELKDWDITTSEGLDE